MIYICVYIIPARKDHANANSEMVVDTDVASEMRLRAEEIRNDGVYLGLFDFLLFSAICEQRVSFMFGVTSFDVLTFIQCEAVLPHLAQLPTHPSRWVAVATWGEQHEAHYNMDGGICMNHWMLGVPIPSVLDPHELEKMRDRPLKRRACDVLDAMVACRIAGHVLHPTVIDGNCAVHTMLMLLHGTSLRKDGIYKRIRDMRDSLSRYLVRVSGDASWQQAWRLACEHENNRRAPAAPPARIAERRANSTDECQAFAASVIEWIAPRNPDAEQVDEDPSRCSVVSWHQHDFGSERVARSDMAIAEDEKRKVVDEAVNAFVPTLNSYPDTVADMPMELRNVVISKDTDFATIVNRLPPEIRQKVCASVQAWEECLARWNELERIPHILAKQFADDERRRSDGRLKVRQGGVVRVRSRVSVCDRAARVKRYCAWRRARQSRGVDDERKKRHAVKNGERRREGKRKSYQARDIPTFFHEQGILFNRVDQEMLRRDIIKFEKIRVTDLTRRKRNRGGGGKPIVGGVLGDELFQWFVDVRGSTKVRVPPKMIIRKVAMVPNK